MISRKVASCALAIVGSACVAGPAFACEDAVLPERPDISAEARARREIYMPLVRKAACEHGVPPALLDALVVQESRYNPRAVSSAGAIGLGQLMPGTARLLGVDPWNPAENLAGAARYLRQQLDEFGSVRLALAAYNAGPGRVRRSRSVPRIAETVNYVATIESDLARWGGGVSTPLPRPPSLATRLQSASDAPVLLAASFEPDAEVVTSPEASPPPRWDVFARFRWERDQQSKTERSEHE